MEDIKLDFVQQALIHEEQKLKLQSQGTLPCWESVLKGY